MAGLQFAGDTLWQLLSENGITCPENVKDILKNTNYDNMCLLANFKPTEDLASITSFYRDTLHQLINEGDREKFYGLYKNKPELFALQGGTSKAILCLAEECKRIMRKRQAPPTTSTEETPPTRVRRTASPQPVSNNNDKPSDFQSHKELLERNINLYCMNTVPEICPDHHYTADAKVASLGCGMYTAKVKCLSPACQFVGTVNMNNLRNWNTSNFYKHLRSHVKNSSSAQRPVSNFFFRVNSAPLVDYDSDDDADNPEVTANSENDDRAQAITDDEEESVTAFQKKGEVRQ